MSIEIDVLNGDASWPTAEPLFNAVWPSDDVEKLPWGHVKWAHADLRVLIEAPSGGLACHVGIYFRQATWDGRKVQIGGIGALAPERRADLAKLGFKALLCGTLASYLSATLAGIVV